MAIKYMGSKARHSKEILKVIFNEIDIKDYKYWIEPMVGGANMIENVPSSLIRIGSDINFHIIEMFNALQRGWEPPNNLSNDEYKYLMSKKNEDLKDLYTNALIGFAGIGCSYSGRWFEGYARGNDSKGNPRNYCFESKKNLMSSMSNIMGVKFVHADYKEAIMPEKSIIYCDPPYFGTKKYISTFDHDIFWQWCREQYNKGNKVFISEYSAPEDWKCIWEKSTNSSLTANTGAKKSIERLFTK